MGMDWSERCLAIAVGATLTLAPAAARAQQGAQPAGAAGAAGAAGSGGATATPATPEAPPAAPEFANPEAERHYQQGRVFFERGNFDAALAEFERAYSAAGGDPHRYRLLRQIGRCHQRRFRYDQAIEFYRRYLDEGGPGAEDRASIEEGIGTLEQLLGTVRVTVSVPTAEIWVDDRRVRVGPGEVRVPGGRHVVQARAPGYVPAQQEVQVTIGEAREVRLSLSQVGSFSGVSPVFTVATGGAAVVAAVAGAVMGVVALNTRNSLETQLRDPHSAAALRVQQSDIDTLRGQAVAADVCFGAAVLFGAGAVVFALITDWGGEHGAESPPAGGAHAARRRRVQPSFSAGFAPGQVGVSVGWQL